MNDLKLIDFEYGAMNYRGFDFGDYFAESAIDYNEPDDPWFKIYEKNFPSVETYEDCLKTYLIFSEYKDKVDSLKAEAVLYSKNGAVDKFIKE